MRLARAFFNAPALKDFALKFVIKYRYILYSLYNIKRISPARRPERVVLLSLFLIVLAGCAGPTRVSDGSRSNAPSVRERNGADDSDVHTDLIRGMLEKQQYYAALAHIEDQKRASGGTRELKLLEAETRRKLGQSLPAEKLYKELLTTEYDGDAQHGLGLLYAARDLNGAVQHLRLAVQRRPTDVLFRNDLGYALMVSGRYKEALPELATAVELDQTGQLSRNNLIMLLLLTKDEARARQVARDSGVSDDELAGLRRKTQSMTKPR
jgi:Flp pilus assembly protein TadD